MYRFSDTPIWLRLTGVIWLMMVVAFGSMIAWETRVNRDLAIEQAKDFAGTVNEMTMAGLTGMMITGTVAQRDVFLDQIKELSVVQDLKVIRGSAVSQVFGDGGVPPPAATPTSSVRSTPAKARCGSSTTPRTASTCAW